MTIRLAVLVALLSVVGCDTPRGGGSPPPALPEGPGPSCTRTDPCRSALPAQTCCLPLEDPKDPEEPEPTAKVAECGIATDGRGALFFVCGGDVLARCFASPPPGRYFVLDGTPCRHPEDEDAATLDAAFGE